MNNNHKLYLMPVIDLPTFKLGRTDDSKDNLERIKYLFRLYVFDLAESYIITAVNDKQIRRFERMLKEDFEDYRYEMPKDKSGHTEFFKIEVLPKVLKYIELKIAAAEHLGLAIEKGVELKRLVRQVQLKQPSQPQKPRQKPLNTKQRARQARYEENQRIIEKSSRDTCIYEILEIVLKNKDKLIYFEESGEEEKESFLLREHNEEEIAEFNQHGTRGFLVSKDVDFLRMIMEKDFYCFIPDPQEEGIFIKRRINENYYKEYYFKSLISFPLGHNNSQYKDDTYYYLQTRLALSNSLNYKKNETVQSIEEYVAQFPKGSHRDEYERIYKHFTLKLPFFKNNIRSKLNRFDKGSMRYNNLINARMLYFQKICRMELKSTTEDFQAFLYYKCYRNSLLRKYIKLYFQEDDWYYIRTAEENWLFNHKPNVPSFMEWLNDNSLDVDVKKDSFRVAQLEVFSRKVDSIEVLREFPLTTEKVNLILRRIQ